MNTRHLVSINDLSDQAIAGILDRADHYAARFGRVTPPLDTLAGRTVISVFHEPSTRTSSSFELAAKRLGATVISLQADTSSATKGESIQDEIQTLCAYDPTVIVLRHPQLGAAREAAEHADRFGVSVVNAGDGTGEHPTQALLDLHALRAHRPLPGTRVWIVGDIRHSRVAGSGVHAFQRAGCHVTVAGPAALLPDDRDALGCPVVESLDCAEHADVIYTLRMQRERMRPDLGLDQAGYLRDWQITRRRLRPGQLLMHPGPVNRGVELAHDVVDDPRSLILDQVRSGVAVRAAILEQLAAA